MQEAPELLDPRDERPAARRQLRAWLALQRSAALRPQAAREGLELCREPLAVLQRLEGATPLGRFLPEAEFQRQLRSLRHCEVHGLPWGSRLYPERLAALKDAPPLLWIRGDPQALLAPAVAIVGARASTASGRAQARRLAKDLVRAGFVIVSGLARGIDSVAHRAALEADGRTLAVLGCGPDRIYPSGHEELADAIARQGAVIAELPPGAPPLRHHFPLRNRLISGLSAAVVVVEARARSGSLITAEHALEQGREVLAVPGAVDAATSVGSNLLLRQGAPPALDASDVLRSLAGTAAAAPPPPSAARPTPTPSHPILRALLEEAATRDELARRLGCPSSKLARELLLLELEGRIVEDRDGRLRAVWETS